MSDSSSQKPRILILGGGFGGAYAAKELIRQNRNQDWEIVLIDREDYVLYYPLLVEATVGIIEARHVVVPIRSFLRKKAQFIMAEVLTVDSEAQTITYKPHDAVKPSELNYDYLIYALGSVT